VIGGGDRCGEQEEDGGEGKAHDALNAPFPGTLRCSAPSAEQMFCYPEALDGRLASPCTP
jgi:hypothetical protein